MATQVLNGIVDVTNTVISYERNHQLCAGIGSITLQVKLQSIGLFSLSDTITIYEEGDKKGEYLVYDITKQADTGIATVSGQDDSKLLSDYFVPTQEETQLGQTTRFWIERMFSDTGVSYNFLSSDQGIQVAKSTIGFQTAFEVITRMVQQSGWTFWFDKDNVCQIGTLTTGLSSYKEIFTESEILTISKVDDSDPLRNRAIVWGSYNFDTLSPIYSSRTRRTQWDIDENDLRAIVLSNQFIESQTSADYFVDRLLDENAQIRSEVTLTVKDHYNIFVNDFIFVKSRLYTGLARIIDLTATVDTTGGRRTTLIINKRCGRTFNVWNAEDYVYIGTVGNGVWRKPLPLGSWEAYNQGIETTHTNDLFVNAGNFNCVTFSGLPYYRNITDSSWSVMEVPTFIRPSGDDTPLSFPSEVKAIKCTMDKLTNQSSIVFNTTNVTGASNVFSWIGEYNGTELLTLSNITTSGIDAPLTNHRLFDAEHNSKELIMTGGTPVSLAYVVWDENGGISSNHNSLLSGDYNQLSYAPQEGASYSTEIFELGFLYATGYIKGVSSYSVYKDRLLVANTSTGVGVEYAFPFDLSNKDYAIYVENEGDADVHIIQDRSDIGGYRHYIFNTDSLTFTYSTLFSVGGTPDAGEAGILQVENVIGSVVRDTGTNDLKLVSYNVLTKTLVETFITLPTVYASVTEYSRVAIHTSSTGLVALVTGGKLLAGVTNIYASSFYTNSDGAISTSGETLVEVLDFGWVPLSVSGEANQFTTSKITGSAIGGIRFTIYDAVSVIPADEKRRISYKYQVETDGNTTFEQKLIEAATDASPFPTASDSLWGGSASWSDNSVYPLFSREGDYVICQLSETESSTLPAFEYFFNLDADTRINVEAFFSTTQSKESARWVDEVSNSVYSPITKSLYNLDTGALVYSLGSIPFVDKYMFGNGFAITWALNSSFRLIFYSNSNIPDALFGGGETLAGFIYRFKDGITTILEGLPRTADVEISKGVPTLIPSRTDTPGDNIYKSYTNESNSFVTASSNFTPFPLVEIRDTRNLHVDYNAQITVVSGIINTELFQDYVFYVADSPTIHGLYGVIEAYSPTDEDREFLLFVPPSGKAHRLETSNFYNPLQYIFTSTSGNPSQFFQSNPSGISASGISFFDQSDNIPTGNVTIIRMDDIL